MKTETNAQQNMNGPRTVMLQNLKELGFVGDWPDYYHDRLHLTVDSNGGVCVEFDDFEDGEDEIKNFVPEATDAVIYDHVLSRMRLVQDYFQKFEAICEGVIERVCKIGVLVHGYRPQVKKPRKKSNEAYYQQRRWLYRWSMQLRVKNLRNWAPIYISSQVLGEINMEIGNSVYRDITSIDHAMQIITNQDRDDCDGEVIRDSHFDGQYIHTEENIESFLSFIFKYGLISNVVKVAHSKFNSDDKVANQLFGRRISSQQYNTIKLRRKIDKEDREMIREIQGRTEK